MKARKSSSIADRAWQRMLSGRRLDLLDPSPLDIEIADIAHGLARVARWNGQTSGAHIFSVAQHTLLVEAVMREQMPRVDVRFRLAALLHDAPEYVIGDMISPFKAVLGGDYKVVEKRLLAAIHIRFGLPPVWPTKSPRRSRPPTAAPPISKPRIWRDFRRPRRSACSAETRPFRGHGARLSDAVDRSQGGEAVFGAIQLLLALIAPRKPAFTALPRAYNATKQDCQERFRIAMLHVCSLAALPETVKATGASHILTVMANVDQVQRPASVLEANHLRVSMDDITEEMDGFLAPSDQHIEKVLNFVRDWDRSAPMVVHCYAGISRSTASAFAAACMLNPHRDEIEIARQIRARSPIASPNRLIVSLADKALGRDGRMLRALDEMGPGTMTVEGRPFRLDLE